MDSLIKKYVLKVVLFFIPVILAVIALEIAARNIEDSFAYKHDFLQNNGNEINTLIFGNSHSYYGIDPNLISDSAFSMALPNQDLLVDFEILKTFSNQWPNLKTVIFNISVSTLLSDSENEVDWRMAYYHFKMHLPNVTVGDANFLNKTSLLYSAGLKPVLKSFQYRLSGQKLKLMCLPKGNGLYKSVASREKLELTGFEASTRHQKDTLEMSDRVNHLKLVADSLTNRGIEVVFVSTPATKYYLNRISPELSGKINYSLNRISENNEKCSFLNYRDSLVLGEELFTDADHLNDQGAVVFTKILAGDLKKL